MPICFIVMWSIFFFTFFCSKMLEYIKDSKMLLTEEVYSALVTAYGRTGYVIAIFIIIIWETHWPNDWWAGEGGEDMMVLGVKRLNICTFLSEVEIWSDSSWSTVVFFPLQRHWECQRCVWPHEVSVNISFIQCSWAWLSLENERKVLCMFWFE